MIGRVAVFTFFVGPGVLVGFGVSLRTSRTVESYEAVMRRVMRFDDAARAAASGEGVELPLLLAVASAESAGRAEARSSAGAVGLMQLMPATAGEMAQLMGEPRPDVASPATSLRLGARYLKRQLDRFADTACPKELALAAYNAGPERVAAWIEAGPAPDVATVTDWIAYPETRAFVRRVLDYEARWRGVAAEASR